jgi:probable addiction module antidote protein
MAKVKVSKFDIAEYLDNEVMIEEYLNNVLEEGKTEDLIGAIGHIAKAKGMSKIANETGMSRPSLYKALSKGSKPQFETIHKVIRALGGNLTVNMGE